MTEADPSPRPPLDEQAVSSAALVNPAWRNKVREGAALCLAALAVWIVLAGWDRLVENVTRSRGYALYFACLGASLTVYWLGTWLLTTRAATGDAVTPPNPLRLALRVAVSAVLLLRLAMLIVLPGAYKALWLALIVIELPAAALFLLYVRRAGQALGDRLLDRHLLIALPVMILSLILRDWVPLATREAGHPWRPGDLGLVLWMIATAYVMALLLRLALQRRTS